MPPGPFPFPTYSPLDLPQNTTLPPVAGTVIETTGPEGSRNIPATAAGVGAAPANLSGSAQQAVLNEFRPFAVSDLPGVFSGSVDSVGRLVVTSGSYTQTLYNRPFGWAEVNHWIYIGQSPGEGAYAKPARSIAQPFSNIMFNGGPRARSAGDRTSFVPLVEIDEGDPLTGTGETPCSGFCNTLSSLLVAENSLDADDYVMLGSTAAVGGQPIASLAPGTANFTRVMDQITAGQTLAHAAGQSYRLQGVVLNHGESDPSTAPATYAQKVLETLAAIQRWASLTDESGYGVSLIAYQVSDQCTDPTKRGALDGLNLARAANPRIIISFPKYGLSYPQHGLEMMHPDRVHFTALGSYMKACKEAQVAKRVTVDGVGFTSLRMVSAHAKGAVVVVTFNNPPGGVEINTEEMGVVADCGFKIGDESGFVTLSPFEVVGLNSVRAVANRAIGRGGFVRYGLDASYTGYTASGAGAGNISTRDALKVVYDAGSGPEDFFFPDFCEHGTVNIE